MRYQKDGVRIDYASNDYTDQYSDFKFFYKYSLGEDLLNPFKSHTDMKDEYPVPFIDLRFQVDHINAKKFQLIEEYRGATYNARLFMILIRHRYFKMISDGNKFSEINFFEY